MYSGLTYASKYLGYLLKASNGKGHGVHSPFVFEFITKVLNDEKEYDCYSKIEAIRNELKQNDAIVTLQDLGAGSRVHDTVTRKISGIARSSLKPAKYAQLLYRIVRYYQPAQVVEMGTSLGVTTCYLASGQEGRPVITMEGADVIAAIAKENFVKAGYNNIDIITGNFDNTLPALMERVQHVDFVFVDGNHREKPTVDYFNLLLQKITEDSILVFDDIHWSNEMENAWRYISMHERVTLSIDLFFIGIVFFRKEQKVKQHFTIRF